MTEAQEQDYTGLSAEEKLRLLVADWKLAKDDRQRAFYEGRMMEVTLAMNEHPEWFQFGCACRECCSYG